MLSESDIFRYLLQGKGQGGVLGTEFFDDSALVQVGDGWQMAISTDFIRGTSFNIAQAGYLTLYDLAHYLVAANASDVAAMGVRPTGFLDVFRYPNTATAVEQQLFFDGLMAAANFYDVTVVGGDSGSYSDYVLSGTCFGFTKSTKPLLRRNLLPGQVLCVAGVFGRCRAAQVALLELGKEHFTEAEIEALLTGWRRPSPPLLLGPWLIENNFSTAGQDTSDGLAATVHSMCEQSGTGISVTLAEDTLSPELVKVARLAERDPVELAIATSPDFCLMFSIAPETLGRVQNNPFGYPITVLGTTTEERTVSFTNATTGTSVAIESYDHKAPIKDFGTGKNT